MINSGMQLSISTPALYILQQLQQHGFDAYIVGGAVRDLLLNHIPADDPRSVTDYDFTTNAKPEQIQTVFPENFYENTFGTVSVTDQHIRSLLKLAPPLPIQPAKTDRLFDAAQATKLHTSLAQPLVVKDMAAPLLPDYQITTYRADEVYDDFRRPTMMTWGESLEQDLQRRDFTVNALALQISEAEITRILSFQNLPEAALVEVTVVDPFNGLTDLNQQVLRAVGVPSQRFMEDALRMLRAIRFSVQLNFTIETETFTAIQNNASLLKHISGERIRDEVLKILASDYPTEGIELLDEAGLLEFIFPELLAAKGIEQGGHHTTDVWTHSLEALRYCPSPDPIVRLATLIHDIAKPETQRFTDTTITFYNHEIIGARVAKKIAQRLKLAKRDVDRIFTLVRYHMFYYQPHNTDAAIRRFMRKVGLENIDDILAVREGDRLGSGARQTSWRLEEMKERMRQQLHQPMEVTDLAINGHDLMTELGLKPGPQIGKILHDLFEKVLDDPELNSKEKLLAAAKQSI